MISVRKKNYLALCGAGSFSLEPTHWSELLQSGCVETQRDGFGRGHQLARPLLSPPPYSSPASPMPDCMHQPHLSSHRFICQSTSLPVALSLSNKDFIVCLVVYKCPRESEYCVCFCTRALAFHQPKAPLKSQLGPKTRLHQRFPKSPNHTSSIFLIAVLQPPPPSASLTLSLSSRALTSPSTFQWQMRGWRFYWLCWSSHFISSSIPLTCQHPSCRRRATKPTWWIASFPYRTSVCLSTPPPAPPPVFFSSISIHRTQI